MKILIADDEALSRRLLEKTLERAGYDVISVDDGKKALEQLCQPDGPRLALLDWVMPGLDGPAVCRAVRKRTEQTYVYMVLLTSKGSKEETVVGLESGADDYLTKPFNAEELRARLRVGERILLLEDRLVEARENMRFRATHDPLTSLLNRGAILDLLGRELHRSYREHTSTVLLLGDVDHFKRVNDTMGHAVGDEVLIEIANRLLAAVRSYDFVGRFGGEEFLAVLNGCDRAYAPGRAEEIRKSISAQPILTAKGAIPLTMSFGVLLSADWGPRPMEELLHEADLALYNAKTAGRDCLRIARPANELSHSQLEQPARQRH
ncbi:MAG TPA: diguanylate cyclase [Candidatus Methylomirabilis sp.]|nr:diguanylate cyclase [Candidatus Methylomirabilis sp.]